MKQLTRQEVEAVVNVIQTGNILCRSDETLYIGNILYWMQNAGCEHEDDETFGMHCKQLCLLWEPLIFTSSLQEICEASGWEAKGHTDICINCHHDVIPCIGKCDEPVLTSPEANALFSFLQEIL